MRSFSMRPERRYIWSSSCVYTQHTTQNVILYAKQQCTTNQVGIFILNKPDTVKSQSKGVYQFLYIHSLHTYIHKSILCKQIFTCAQTTNVVEVKTILVSSTTTQGISAVDQIQTKKRMVYCWNSRLVKSLFLKLHKMTELFM